MQFAEIILPFNLGNTFTYGIPVDMQGQVIVGTRVEVPFRNKQFSGIVFNIHNNKPATYAVKPILQLIDAQPIVTTIHLQFWQWIQQYYCCSLGEVMNQALPSFLKLSSETIIVKNESIEVVEKELSDDEFQIMEALSIKNELNIAETEKILPKNNARKAISGLLAKQYIATYENVKELFTPKTEIVLQLHENLDNEEALKETFNTLEKSPKQLHVLLAFLHLITGAAGVKQADLIEKSGASSAHIKALVDKNILVSGKQQINRITFSISKEYQTFELSKAQQIALQLIQKSFIENKPALLYGVTGSGKTNVHIKLMKPAVEAGKQILYLLPEIALTPQIINKVHSAFSGKVAVYHSRFSNHQRVETWQAVSNGKAQIIIGARSSLFLPFSNLQLIIVDEEHDSSYKQQDPSPRFQARDAAVYLAHLCKANILLSSATPSIESLYNAQNNRYTLVQLQERFGEASLPTITIVDNKTIPTIARVSPLLSNVLIEKMQETMRNKKQIILFQNRRGYAPYLYCSDCGWNAKCKHCDVSISYHKTTDKLHCHYCGTKFTIIKLCPSCSGAKLYFKNWGTERVEDEVKRIFPNAIVDRLDVDTANTKNKYQNIIKNVEKNITNILIGTQMVAKGLDFDSVQLVGVLSADSLFAIPDYRVAEKAFQMLSQVSGRAGRQDAKGEVVIQLLDTTNKVVQQVQQHDYLPFVQQELEHRKTFEYPPFIRLIKVTIKHLQTQKVLDASTQLASYLQAIANCKITGPSDPLIAKINNDYIKEIWIKCSRDNKQLLQIKHEVQHYCKFMQAQKNFTSIKMAIDVDPAF